MKTDLTGQRFGKLVALEPMDLREHGAVVWRCRCDCGREVLVESRRLKPGVIESCGCTPAPQETLVGRRFGRLTVLEKTEKRAKNRSVLWKCRCDCGSIVEATRDQLLSGGKTSCGCAKTPPLKDWIGRRFGSLEVLEYAGKRKGCHMWRCRCDCGKILTVRQSNLQDGTSTSCGCMHPVTDKLHFVDGTCVERIRSKKLSRTNTSGVRGVYYNKRRNKWTAQIMFKGKTYYLGSYATLEEAAKARRRGEEMYDNFLDWFEKEYDPAETGKSKSTG